MVLVRLMSEHPSELRADFQHWYGLNLDDMGASYSALHAADLAANLPPDSCCGRAEDPMNAWTDERQLLALIEYYLHTWLWWHTKDAKHRRHVPELRIPSEKETSEGMPVDDMMGFLDSLVGRDGGDGY